MTYTPEELHNTICDVLDKKLATIENMINERLFDFHFKINEIEKILDVRHDEAKDIKLIEADHEIYCKELESEVRHQKLRNSLLFDLLHTYKQHRRFETLTFILLGICMHSFFCWCF